MNEESLNIIDWPTVRQWVAKQEAMNHRTVWIVEMKPAGSAAWSPTVGCSLTRDDAKREMQEWTERNPDDRFRLRQYVAKKP